MLLILPWAMPNYITALIWKGMFHQQFGAINRSSSCSAARPSPGSTARSPRSSTVLTTNGWLGFPFMMVVSLGALQSIPADLYEAARVDGASRWQQFRSITLPSLRPALVPAVILSVIWTFNLFNVIYLVSGGEPGSSTEILVTAGVQAGVRAVPLRLRRGLLDDHLPDPARLRTWQNRVTRATEAIG